MESAPTLPRLSILIPFCSSASKITHSITLSRRALIEQALSHILKQFPSLPLSAELLFALPESHSQLRLHLQQAYAQEIRKQELKIPRMDPQRGSDSASLLQELSHKAQGQTLLFGELTEVWQSNALKKISAHLQDQELLAIGQGPQTSSDWLRSLLSGECQPSQSLIIRRSLYDQVGPISTGRLAGNETFELLIKAYLYLDAHQRRHRFSWLLSQGLIESAAPLPDDRALKVVRKVENHLQRFQEFVTELALARKIPAAYRPVILQRVPLLKSLINRLRWPKSRLKGSD